MLSLKEPRNTLQRCYKSVFWPILSDYTLTIGYQEYDGRLNFATDAWSSPNNRAFLALLIYFELDGEPVVVLLDCVEVATSHTGETMGMTLGEILEDYGISSKVSKNPTQSGGVGH
jgi:hypothetical protein